MAERLRCRQFALYHYNVQRRGPVKGDPYFINNDGKEAKYDIDANAIWEDGSLVINGTTYQPVDEEEE